MTGSLAVVVYERMSGIVALLVFALLASLLKIRFVREMPLLYVSLLVSLSGIFLLLLAWKKVPRGFLAGAALPPPLAAPAPGQAGHVPRHHPGFHQPPFACRAGSFSGRCCCSSTWCCTIF